MNRPRIAFITASDPLNRRSWSGTLWNMFHALERHCGDVIAIGPIPLPPRIVLPARAGSLVTKTLLGTHIHSNRTRAAARFYAKEVSRRLEAQNFDVIVAPAGSFQIGLLETLIPIVYISDSTFRLLDGYYFHTLSARTRKVSEEMEQGAISRSTLLIYPSRWAAASAIRDYGASPEKIALVPFGANVDEIPTDAELAAREVSQTCRLVLVGIDWDRKGGDIALDALTELRRRGVDAELTICGMHPPDGRTPPRVRLTGFLDKRDPAAARELRQILMESHFAILPARAECFSIALLEAAAFGLPAITSRTGGLEDAVEEGVTGMLLPLEAVGSAYADAIESIWIDRDRYHSMVQASRQRHDSVLNWDQWGRTVSERIQAIV